MRAFPHDPRSSFSHSILLRAATGSAGTPLESSTDDIVNCVLDAHGGLPLALAVARRAMFKIAIGMNLDYDRAIPLY